MMTGYSSYVQPVAQHRDYPERLVLLGSNGCAYVWHGSAAGALPEEIAAGTAEWLLTQSWTTPLPEPRMWFAVTDLPVTAAPSTVHAHGDERE